MKITRSTWQKIPSHDTFQHWGFPWTLVRCSSQTQSINPKNKEKSQRNRSDGNVTAPVLRPRRRWEEPPTATFPHRHGRPRRCTHVGSCWWVRSSSSWSPFSNNDEYQNPIRKNGYVMRLSGQWRKMVTFQFSQVSIPKTYAFCVCIFAWVNTATKEINVTEYAFTYYYFEFLNKKINIRRNRTKVTRCMD